MTIQNIDEDSFFKDSAEMFEKALKKLEAEGKLDFSKEKSSQTVFLALGEVRINPFDNPDSFDQKQLKEIEKGMMESLENISIFL